MMKQVKFRFPVRMLALLCGLLLSASAFAQQITVNGHVKDATGEPVIGRQVPAPPAIPIHVGAVVQNVGTAFAIYQAVMKNKPLIDRVITVTGKSVKNPSNLLARLGTPFSQLIDECGGLPEDTGKIIGGGPMMGSSPTYVPF